MTENEKAKFQNPFTHNDQRNFVECNPVKKISDDLVYVTKSHTSSVSDSIFSEEREEIAEDLPAPAEDIPAPAPSPSPSEEREEITEDVPAPAEDVPAPTPAPVPAPADTLEKVEGQPYTPGSRKSTKKNFGRPASAYSDFYM